MANLKGKDYIETQDLSDAELGLLLDTATDLKQKFHRGEPTLLLPHQTAFLLFFDKSTRTRNAFEAGMTQLGGHAHFLDSDATQISHGETPEDTGKILASMGHGICIRHDLVLNEGNTYMRRDGRRRERADHQHAVRRRPSHANAGRPDDDPREVRQRI